MAISVGLVGVWLTLREASIHRLKIKTYVSSAQTLKRGTPVWVDGVHVGSVTSVRLRPEVSGRPVEVVMQIETPYELTIPSDSVAKLSAQGVLGPTVIDIDTRSASGSATAYNGAIKSDERVANFRTADALEKVGNLLIGESRKLRDQNGPTAPSSPK